MDTTFNGEGRRFGTPALLLCLIMAVMPAGCTTAGVADGPGRPVLVIHGGAGTPSPGELTPERDRAYRAGLEAALLAGHAVLATNGSSLDAVTAAIRVLEDDPLFNAGRGAALNRAGVAELDAAVMAGATRRAGAVAGVKTVRNPIDAARAVMERTPHVLIAGEGADAFARSQGLRTEPPAYFVTDARRKQLAELLESEGRRSGLSTDRTSAFGTVGAVALDAHGDLAAGTSTGGLAGKRPGRIGDSPIIGAGTYADNATCAVSATGQGEFFIRAAVAHDIASLMRYRGADVRTAAAEVVLGTLVRFGGEGGVIALDRRGRFAMPYNSEGMFRGWIGTDGIPRTAIHAK